MHNRLIPLLHTAARWCFGIAIILSPFRFRFTLQSRPVGAVYGDYTDFLLFAGDIAVIAALTLWGAALAVGRRRVEIVPRFVGVPLAALTGVGLFGAVFSIDPPLSLYHGIRLSILFCLYLYVVGERITWRDVALPAALMVAVQAAIGIAQFLRQHSLGLYALGEYELDPAWNGVSIVWANGTRFLRVYGLSDHPNLLGGCLAFALLAIAVWHAEAGSSWRSAAVGVFAVGALALMLTFSRAAWLAFGVGAAVCLILLYLARQRQALVAWLALMSASAVVLAPFAWQNAAQFGVRLNRQESSARVEDEERSFYERNVLNEAANRVFANHALTGVGLGALPIALSRAYPNLTVNYQPAHLALLDAAAETGIVGATVYSILLCAPWLVLWLTRKHVRLTPALIGASGLLAAVTVVGFFDYYTWLLAPGRFWQWLAWGIWSAAYLQAARGAADA